MARLIGFFMLAVVLMSGSLALADDGLIPARIQLRWVAQAQFAGYYAAQALGFYADEGLDIAILESRGDISPVQALADGDAEFGVTWLPKTLIARQNGVDLVNIAQIFQRSGSILVSFADSGIEAPNDIVHKTIGFWPNGNEHEVFALTFHIGSDPISGEHTLLIPQPFHLGPLLAGELDAAQALIYNGYGALLGTVNPATGKLYTEDELNIIDFNEIGIAMLQDHIVVRGDWLMEAGNQAIASAMLRASLRGWIYCRDHADDCVDILLEINPDLDRSHQQWMMNEVNRLIWPSPQGIGRVDEALWEQTVGWLLRIGALEEPPDPEAYCDDLLMAGLESLGAEGLDIAGAGWQPAD